MPGWYPFTCPHLCTDSTGCCPGIWTDPEPSANHGIQKSRHLTLIPRAGDTPQGQPYLPGTGIGLRILVTRPPRPLLMGGAPKSIEGTSQCKLGRTGLELLWPPLLTLQSET